jgi:hypothetical protein
MNSVLKMEQVGIACEDNIADSQARHDNYPPGCSKAAGSDAYLNYLKNETPSPATTGVTFLDQSAFDSLNVGTPDGMGKVITTPTSKISSTI